MRSDGRIRREFSSGTGSALSMLCSFFLSYPTFSPL